MILVQTMRVTYAAAFTLERNAVRRGAAQRNVRQRAAPRVMLRMCAKYLQARKWLTITTRDSIDDRCWCSYNLVTLVASSGKRNATVRRPAVRLSVCPIGILTMTHQGSMWRGQRTFRPDNKDRHTSLLCMPVIVLTSCYSTSHFSRHMQIWPCARWSHWLFGRAACCGHALRRNVPQ